MEMHNSADNYCMKPALLVLALTAVAFAQPGGGPPSGGPGMPPGGDGIWRRWALYGEGQTFDACLGHQPGTGDYHHHAEPLCLRAQLNDNLVLIKTLRTGPVYAESPAPWTHSPILGWAFDGYPIYGPYGFTDPMNSSSPVKRMVSGYRLRAITARTTLPDWALPNHSGVSQTLTAAQYGPAVSTAFPLGRYVEDFEYVAGLGDLDQYNGRLEVTPDFPGGTYAYHVTIDASGSPVFPLIYGGQLYGVASGGMAKSIPSDVNSYFSAPSVNVPIIVPNLSSAGPNLTSWSTQNSSDAAQAISGFDPSAGASATWPTNQPAGFSVNGGDSTPTNADVQAIQYDSSNIYIKSKGLPSYVIGPWFDGTMTGGIFANFPAAQSYQMQFPRSPAEVASGGTRTSTSMGPSGLYVNGVEASGFLDGASYSNSTGTDVGGGTIFQAALHVSAASGEKGPVAPGSLVTGYALFGAQLATTTLAASSATWPTALGGTTVTVKDSSGTSRQAPISYVSPSQVNFQVPSDTATGVATVTYSNGSATVPGNLFVVSAYPNLFSNAAGQPLGYVARLHNGVQTIESLNAPIAINAADSVYLVFYGSGIGNAANVQATLGDVSAAVAYAGPQGTFAGLDQYNVLVPSTLAKNGPTNLTITVAGRPSNTVTVNLQ